ncbi:MAG: hypothetical protein HGA45_37885 [Chloroflexales bacterium]|nr:hypothetical protein [Chloroflexales bacterium]
MRSLLPHRAHAMVPAHATRSVGALVGLIGGLAGTVVMDLFGAGLFVMMGAPASLAFTIIGDAAAGFAATRGLTLTGGAALGALLHYLIGLGLGGLFGIVAVQVPALRSSSALKTMAMSILYVELVSQPLLTAAALILQMTAGEMAQWFGLSAVLHLIYGLVLGLVVFLGLRNATIAPA